MFNSGLLSAYLVGMTDSAGSEKANLALSAKRASAASKYLSKKLSQLGVFGAVITTESMGEYLSTTKNGVIDPYERKVSVMVYPTI
jgi:outer membrane protein OmpA-like peptidoglycan-associated protein